MKLGLKRWVAVLLLAVVASVGAMIGSEWWAYRRALDAPPSPLIGTPLPGFALPTLHDPQRTLGSETLRGEPYLLNVWATWCASCKAEHRTMLRLAQSGRIRIIGYNWDDDRDAALEWLKYKGNPYSAVVADRSGETAATLSILGTPHHILVDAGGIIRWKRTGVMTEELIRTELLPALAALKRER